MKKVKKLKSLILKNNIKKKYFVVLNERYIHIHTNIIDNHINIIYNTKIKLFNYIISF